VTYALAVASSMLSSQECTAPVHIRPTPNPCRCPLAADHALQAAKEDIAKRNAPEEATGFVRTNATAQTKRKGGSLLPVQHTANDDIPLPTHPVLRTNTKRSGNK